MFEIFETFIAGKANLTKEDLQLIRSLSIVKKIRKKELLLQEGEVCRYKIFVAKGLLVNYRIKYDGTEHILRFAAENTWTADPESYDKQIPSKNNIEAIENSVVVLFPHESINELMTAIPEFKIYANKLISNTLYATQERIIMNISATSEEKYMDFATTFPDILNRVPLHMVASYLGVSRETLSRIRHAQLKH